MFSEHQQQVISLTKDKGELCCYPGWLSPSESSHYFEIFLNELAWDKETLMTGGKIVESPRLVAWYGDEGKIYRYYLKSYKALPWHTALYEIKEKLSKDFNVPINSVLTNL